MFCMILVKSSFNIAIMGKFGDIDGSNKHKYSILLPTYNEKENLPLIIWLIMKHLEAR